MTKDVDEMMPSWFPVEGKTYVVLGLARSGLAAVKWLRGKGAYVLVADDNAQKIAEAEALGAKAISETIPWDHIAALIQSPGVPLWKPLPHPYHNPSPSA